MRFFLFLALVVSAQSVHAQARTPRDSVNLPPSFKKAPWYVRSMPFSIYAMAGKPADRIAQSLEVGKSFNVLDVGIAVGRNSLRPDTTFLVQGRVTMDVGNYGIFANEMTIGAGKVFDSRGSLMLELTYSILAQVAPRFGIGLTTGFYDFSNEVFDSSRTFYGIYVRFGVERTDSGGLLGMGRRFARPHVHGRRGR
jgi:hypothetical protein